MYTIYPARLPCNAAMVAQLITCGTSDTRSHSKLSFKSGFGSASAPFSSKDSAISWTISIPKRSATFHMRFPAAANHMQLLRRQHHIFSVCCNRKALIQMFPDIQALEDLQYSENTPQGDRPYFSLFALTENSAELRERPMPL